MSFQRNEIYFLQLKNRLDRSEFRRKFHLHDQERTWLIERGMDTARVHAADFISRRLAPANPAHDGKQTPMKGHPVFIAQHATACCCRGCLEKWHHIPKGKPLNDFEQAYIQEVLVFWLEQQVPDLDKLHLQCQFEKAAGEENFAVPVPLWSETEHTDTDNTDNSDIEGLPAEGSYTVCHEADDDQYPDEQTVKNI